MDIEQLAGTRLGNYEIESLLGRGGMGVVYKARQLSLNRPVALKILPPHLSSDTSFVKRFHREAQAIAQLHHANIVQVYDIGEDQNLHFFSMEYMEGQTLDDILMEKGRLGIDEAIRIVSEAAKGLEHAHKNGIIHRDIKPANIILGESDTVKVMDFGLARSTQERSKLTQSGTLMGTLDYMSPEQCRGEELDGRTDIYSLGVVLYEMLTGKAPFDAPNEAAMIHKIISENPAEAKRLNPNISNDLNAIVSRAISKNKSERYESISEFLENLQHFEKDAASILTIKENISPSIAVLPFANMSADPDQEYFCDGLAEEIINALTQIKDLHVVARTSAFFFKGKDVKIRDIGKELNVKTVLEGSVRKAGNRVRITAQLVNVVDGYHLWSERYDRELDDVFAIQDEITTAIVKKLRPKLLHEERPIIARRRTIDLEAYNLYLRGRYFWNKRTEEGQRKAFEYFKRAIAKDSGCALAYAGLADYYIMCLIFTTLPPRESLPKVKEAALKALELDDSLAEAHVSLAYVRRTYEWDWEGAEQEYRQAIELNPGCADAHCWYALHLMHMARFDKAIQEIERARELDPLSLPINRYAGMIFLNSRRYDEAIEASKRAIEMEPNISYVRLDLGLAYFGKSMYEEAMVELEKEKAISGRSNPAADTAIGVASALMGERDKAQKILDRLLERSTEQYIPPFFCALLHFSLGENDLAFDWLGKAYDEHDPYLSFLKVQPSFDMLNLHSDPRYQAMLKKIGLDK